MRGRGDEKIIKCVGCSEHPPSRSLQAEPRRAEMERHLAIEQNQMSRPRSMTPTLASVAANQNAIAEATSNDLTALLAETAAVQSVLTAALLRRRRAEREHESHRADSRPITVQAAAELSTLSLRWFYRRANKPGFSWIRRLSARNIRVDAAALEDFLRATGK
jgi:hypothetical protein